ncbi:MAG: SRPBCC domain-containing protein [Leeuwenhoekiella sp.]
MEKIAKKLNVKIAREKAYHIFLNELGGWWPREYTWSQEKLIKIGIDPKINGLCFEIGPHGFRCDWGRVTALEENHRIKLKWQISPKREPIPNPDRASDLSIVLITNDQGTTLLFEHLNFENHGDGAKEYRNVMNGTYGWDYILGKYKKYCEMKESNNY